MSAAPCPICQKAAPAGTDVFPFCSKRCKLIDLGNWLGERYRVPDTSPVDIDEDAGEHAPPRGE